MLGGGAASPSGGFGSIAPTSGGLAGKGASQTQGAQMPQSGGVQQQIPGLQNMIQQMYSQRPGGVGLGMNGGDWVNRYTLPNMGQQGQNIQQFMDNYLRSQNQQHRNYMQQLAAQQQSRATANNVAAAPQTVTAQDTMQRETPSRGGSDGDAKGGIVDLLERARRRK